jgi:hypothetical protein
MIVLAADADIKTFIVAANVQILHLGPILKNILDLYRTDSVVIMSKPEKVTGKNTSSLCNLTIF